MKAKDWTNQKIHRLTFIKPTSGRRGGKILWEAQCECGKIITILPNTALTGNNISCGCWKKRHQSEMCGKAGEKSRKHSPIVSSARAVWRMCYRDCDFELFLRLSQQPCYYCGIGSSKTYNIADKPSTGYTSKRQKEEGTFTHNGLDRLDNSKGHVEGNVVSCCSLCNYAKRTLTVGEFLAHIERMYNGTRRLLTPCRTDDSLALGDCSAT